MGIARSVVVIKVGGSCLAEGKTIKQIVEKIKSVRKKGLLPILVVSALKGMTDSLMDVAKNTHNKKDPGHIDNILSEGEQLSARILVSALNNSGLKAKALQVNDNFPIITDNRHGQAEILIDETKKKTKTKLLPLIKNKVIPVVPGFIGRTKRGKVTTIGRGGSDTTAVVLGKILKPKEVILLKDVPGILSGEPNTVKDARKLKEITVEEALNLSLKGGEVLCQSSLIYKPEDVGVRIVNFDNGDLLTSGTLVTGTLNRCVDVKLSENKSAVTVIGKRMDEMPGLLAHFSEQMVKNKINIYSLSASKYSICFYVDKKNRVKALHVLHSIVEKSKNLTAVTSIKDITLITVTGLDFAIKKGVLGKIGTLLAKHGINIADISTSGCEADILVDSTLAKKAKKILEVSL
ncbi:MAG: aspartate kinase [Nanoarchaeota archaeon]